MEHYLLLEMLVQLFRIISLKHKSSVCLVYFVISFQLLFISGLVLVIGIQRTVAFFFQRHKVKASSLFLGGIIVVLIGWPLLGIVAEIWGFFLLFGQVSFFGSFPFNFL